MSLTFNADEIFKIGVQIEKNGYAFYSAAAKRSDNEEIKQLLRELAHWEEQHIEIFEKLRKELSTKIDMMEEFDPDNMVHLYLKSIADSKIFVKGQRMDEEFNTCNSPSEVLAVALAFEKDSVVFYSSMKEAVRSDLGKDDIDKLIREELLHVGIITQELAKLR
ncbi:MAG TPA: ferritin family protein [Chitinispirillaceae bacterium]|nr:ferritin family protein [Chitinispirillaceae bacterium]